MQSLLFGGFTHNMLHIQEYLKTYNTLPAHLNLKVRYHDTLPLMIINYDQIESNPKTDPIIRECRGLVLNSDTYDLVARSFSRFFNWGEVQEEMERFEWNSCQATAKEDGSLILIYYHEDDWHINTRGSFAQDRIHNDIGVTWEQAVLQALDMQTKDDLWGYFVPHYTYVCELCSPYNKVVRQYDKPTLYLLSVFEGEVELSYEATRNLCPLETGIKLPLAYTFSKIEHIEDFLTAQASLDPTFEGVVIRDANNLRYKVKNKTYLALHRLKGAGDNLFLPKNLLPFILTGEEAELLTYFPEVKTTLETYKHRVHAAWEQLKCVFLLYKDISLQKDFALTIKDKTPFTSLLFTLRRNKGAEATLHDLRDLWQKSEQLILKVLF